jgi:hypothetical protein
LATIEEEVMNQALFDAGMAVKTEPITQPDLTQDKALSERPKS